MDKHPYFTSPVTTARYSKEKYRIVGYELSPVEKVSSCFDIDSGGKQIIKTVVEILSTNISNGFFNNHERPKSFLAILE